MLITFDKDFGEPVFREGRTASRGVILLRPRLRSPEIVCIHRECDVPTDRPGPATSLSREGLLRVVPLP